MLIIDRETTTMDRSELTRCQTSERELWRDGDGSSERADKEIAKVVPGTGIAIGDQMPLNLALQTLKKR